MHTCTCASVSVEVCDMLWLFRQLVHLKFCGMAQLCGGNVKQFVNCILARLSAFCLHLSVATEATRHCLHACGVASLMIARPTMLLCMQNKTIFELHFLNVECSFCIAQVNGLKNANCAFLQSENESTWSISMRNY